MIRLPYINNNKKMQILVLFLLIYTEMNKIMEKKEEEEGRRRRKMCEWVEKTYVSTTFIYRTINQNVCICDFCLIS